MCGDAALGMSEEFYFTTSPSAAAPYPMRLGIIADLGETENSTQTIQHLLYDKPQFVTLIGDLTCAPLTPATSPLCWAVIFAMLAATVCTLLPAHSLPPGRQPDLVFAVQTLMTSLPTVRQPPLTALALALPCKRSSCCTSCTIMLLPTACNSHSCLGSTGQRLHIRPQIWSMHTASPTGHAGTATMSNGSVATYPSPSPSGTYQPRWDAWFRWMSTMFATTPLPAPARQPRARAPGTQALAAAARTLWCLSWPAGQLV